MVRSGSINAEEWIGLAEADILDYFKPNGDGRWVHFPGLSEVHEAGYLYCGIIDNRTIKIGGTGKFPHKRFRQHGDYIEPIFWLPVSCWREAEARVHIKLRQHRPTMREEFNVSPMVAFETMQCAFLDDADSLVQAFDPAHILTIRRAHRRHVMAIQTHS